MTPTRCYDHPIYRRGCRTCQIANRTRVNHRYRALAYGTWDKAHVDPTRARQHVLGLLAWGMSSRQIASRAGVAHTTIAKLARGRHYLANQYTEQAILGVTYRPPANRRYLDSTPAALWLRDLQYHGWDSRTLAKHLGVRAYRIDDWRRKHRPLISAHRHNAIRDLYIELYDEPGPSDRAHEQAKQSGHRPPYIIAPDGTIEDPTDDTDWELKLQLALKGKRPTYTPLEHLLIIRHGLETGMSKTAMTRLLRISGDRINRLIQQCTPPGQETQGDRPPEERSPGQALRRGPSGPRPRQDPHRALGEAA